MTIKALLQNGIIKPLEPIKKMKDGLVEVDIRKPHSKKKSIVKQTLGSFKLPKKVVQEIAESDDILDADF